jgi:hypothetical protein
MIRHDFYEGKYTVVFEGNRFYAYRYGAEWRDLCGDGLVLAMLQDYDELKTRYDALIAFMNQVSDGTTDEEKTLEINADRYYAELQHGGDI